MEIRPLSAEEASHVPEVWNAAWREPNPYPLGAPLWRERLASPHHDPELLLGAVAEGEVLAYAHGKRPVSTWQPPNLAWVSSFAVRRSLQGRGIGTALVRQVAQAAAEVRGQDVGRAETASESSKVVNQERESPIAVAVSSAMLRSATVTASTSGL